MENNMGFDMEKCGALISRLRKQAGYTQAGLAQRLGISYQAVSSWERGASMPDIGKLRDLANALNTTVDHILSGDASYAPQPLSEPPVPAIRTPEHKEEAAAEAPAAGPGQPPIDEAEQLTEDEAEQPHEEEQEQESK
ncbi:MAG: helix-turn-helix transcriptional regulator, partial [Clostridia bacterium]|nr:helix-turn-helix transcriptional regulator [Clostridia bacterium]